MGTFYEEQPDGTSKKVAPTLDYFYQECSRFRKLMGEKSFWDKPLEIRELAPRALGIVYVNLEPKSTEENEQGIVLFEITMDEYNRRERFMLFHPRKA